MLLSQKVLLHLFSMGVLLCVYSHLYRPAAICMYPARVQILLSHPPLGRKMVMMANKELTASRAQPPEQSTALVWGTQKQNSFILAPFIYWINTKHHPDWHIFTTGRKLFILGKLHVLSCSHKLSCVHCYLWQKTPFGGIRLYILTPNRLMALSAGKQHSMAQQLGSVPIHYIVA